MGLIMKPGLGKRLIRAVALSLALGAPLVAKAESITVFAAASLKTVLDQVSDEYAAHSGHKVRFSFAGSSALARQIQLGAPADIFVSANPGWMNALEDGDLIAPDTRVDLVGNRLVVIAPKGAVEPLDLDDAGAFSKRLSEGPLAMALLQAVPAGIYGKEALETLGIWPDVADKVAQTDNVRAALALVSIGEASLGIVYATDVQADPDVAIVADVPAATHAPIIYPAAIIAGRESEEAANFLNYLQSPEAQAVFAAHGFLLVGG